MNESVRVFFKLVICYANAHGDALVYAHKVLTIWIVAFSFCYEVLVRILYKYICYNYGRPTTVFYSSCLLVALHTLACSTITSRDHPAIA